MNVNKVAYVIHQLAVALAREDAEFSDLREDIEEHIETLDDCGVIGNGSSTDFASWEREIAGILSTSTVA